MARLRLNEDAAIKVLLVRAIESEDSEAAVLTRDDRRFASSAALASAPPGEPGDGRRTAAFLAARASLALDRLLARYPTLRRVCSLSRWPAWISWAIPAAALLLGLSSNAFDGRRLNILAFPLLGLIAWNLAVYAILIARTLTGRKRGAHDNRGGPLRHALDWVIRPASARLAAQPTLERGVARFARDWTAAAGPLTGHRASRTLHLGAAMLAIGIIAGMLFRARYIAEFEAGWAGTWAGAEAEIARLLGIILGPASALTGIALPDAARLRELRGSDENAGNWLILWAVTALLFVIVPRLILALVHAARAAVLQRRLPVPEDFYVRSVLRNALDRPGTARVIAYSFDPPAAARDRLERLLKAALGDQTRVEIDPSVAYGEEDRWLANEGQRLTQADHLILLFNLSSTPEAENHGAFVAGVAQRAGGGGAGLTVLLDDSSFRQTIAGQPSADRRIGGRVDAWRAVLSAVAVQPVRVSLDSPDEAASARTIEQAMLRAPVAA